MPFQSIDTQVTLVVDNSAATNLAKSLLPVSQSQYIAMEETRKWQAKIAGGEYTPLTNPIVSIESLNRKIGIEIRLLASPAEAQFSRFDDRTIDVLDYLSYEIHKRANAVNDCITVHVDEVCNALGFRKIKAGNGYRGGHRFDNRDRVMHNIELLESLWICTRQTRSVKGKSGNIILEQRLFAIVEKVKRDSDSNQFDSKRHKTRLISVTIKVGNFFSTLLSSRPQITKIPIALLAYDPQKYLWEKRLGKYLYRFPSRTHHIRSIFAGCRFNLTGNRLYRIQHRFDAALQKLQNDGLIENYRYVDSAFDRRSPNWFESWLDAKIQVVLRCRSP